jgi:hypothetical protein
MPVVRVARTFPGSVHEGETLWYDTARWPLWIDGVGEVTSVEGDWPRTGATVIWESVPAGRGRVVERVVSHEPLGGQSSEVEDQSIRGTQSVAFTPANGEIEVELTLSYTLKQRSIIMPLLDFFFIRRAMRTSLTRTLSRFGVELAAARAARAR